MNQEDFVDSDPNRNSNKYNDYENSGQDYNSPQDSNNIKNTINNKKKTAIEISADIYLDDKHSYSAKGDQNYSYSPYSDEESQPNKAGNQNNERNIASRSKHSMRKNQNYNYDSYSAASNNIRSSQLTSGLYLHYTCSSSAAPPNNSDSYMHIEASSVSQTNDRDIKPNRTFKATETQSKKASKQRPRQQQSQKLPNQQEPQYQPQPSPQQQQQPLRQQQPKQLSQQRQRPNYIEDSPDSYQISDKIVDRDVDPGNNSGLYTYDYISESNSYYQRNLQNIQQQRPIQQRPLQKRQPSPQRQLKPNQDFDDDQEYTYTYEYPTSSVDFNGNNNYRYDNGNNRNPNYNRNNYNPIQNREANFNSDDDSYTYTYDSATAFNESYDNRQQLMPQPKRSIRAEIIPKSISTRGAPNPIKMQLQVPSPMGAPADFESTNDYTYTYDEPTTEERKYIEAMNNKSANDPNLQKPAKNFAVSNYLQFEVPPAEPKKKNNKKSNKNNKLSPRKMRIQEKINKLKKNLNKLEEADNEDYESADPNDNQRVNFLNQKLSNLTGYKISPRNGQFPIDDTKSYTYTFEYESEVYPELKNKSPDLQLASPMGVISIEAKKQPFVIERNASPHLEDSEPNKPNLSISPAVQSESSNERQLSQLQQKKEKLQEIDELKKRLKLLQDQVSDDTYDTSLNCSYETENESGKNRIRVKKRVRVQKQVKLPDDFKQQPKMKKVHRKVRVDKQRGSHHHHRHGSRENSESEESDAVRNRDVNIDNEMASSATTRSEQLQLLDESSSSQQSSGVVASPKSPLRLLEESDDSEGDVNNSKETIKVKVVALENIPDVDAFCVLFFEDGGEARKTHVIQKGARKDFNQLVELPLPADVRQSPRLVVLAKKQDLIKGDKMLGSANVEIDVESLRDGKETDTWLQLCSDAGIQTSGKVHIIISPHDGNEKKTKQNVSEDTQKVTNRNIPEDTQKVTNRNISEDTQKVTNRNISEDTQKVTNRNISEDTQKVKNRNISEDTQKVKNRNISEDTQKVTKRNVQIVEDNEEIDENNSLKPSNFTIPKDVQNRLKIQRLSGQSDANDISGVFILDLPTQSALDNDEQAPSSSFITDLVNNKSEPSNSNQNSNQNSVDFSKSDKIVHNLERDIKMNPQNRVRPRSFVIDDSEDEYEKDDEQKTRNDQKTQKKRIIKKIEDENEENGAIHIDLKFYSSYSDNDYVSNDNYSDNEKVDDYYDGYEDED